MDNDELILEAIEKMIQFHQEQVSFHDQQAIRFRRMLSVYNCPVEEVLSIESDEPSVEEPKSQTVIFANPADVKALNEGTMTDAEFASKIDVAKVTTSEKTEIKETDLEIKPPVSTIKETIPAITDPNWRKKPRIRTPEQTAAWVANIKAAKAAKKAAGSPGPSLDPVSPPVRKILDKVIDKEKKDFAKKILPTKLIQGVTGEKPAKIVRPPAQYSNKRPYEFANSLI